MLLINKKNIRSSGLYYCAINLSKINKFVNGDFDIFTANPSSNIGKLSPLFYLYLVFKKTYAN